MWYPPPPTPEDLRRVNDKLVETNASKMGLQVKLDDLEISEINIKASHAGHEITFFAFSRCFCPKRLPKESFTKTVEWSPPSPPGFGTFSINGKPFDL